MYKISSKMRFRVQYYPNITILFNKLKSFNKWTHAKLIIENKMKNKEKSYKEKKHYQFISLNKIIIAIMKKPDDT